MSRKDVRVLILVILAGLICAGRLLPHAPNFTPMAACGLFAAWLLGNRRLAIAGVLAALLVTDAWIGFYQWQVMLCVYAALLVPALLAPRLRGRFFLARLTGVSLLGSLVFFVTTNLAVWLFSGGYAATWAGLTACFTAALPFFRYTLLGDLAFSGMLFGAYGLAHHAWLSHCPARPAPALAASAG